MHPLLSVDAVHLSLELVPWLETRLCVVEAVRGLRLRDNIVRDHNGLLWQKRSGRVEIHHGILVGRATATIATAATNTAPTQAFPETAYTLPDQNQMG